MNKSKSIGIMGGTNGSVHGVFDRCYEQGVINRQFYQQLEILE